MSRERGGRFRCIVEERLTEGQGIELDILLADPSRWPRAIFEGWKLPEGSLPATMRTWGAIEVGLNFMADRGHTDVTRRQMQNHYEKHVPILPENPDDIVARGVAAEDPQGSTPRHLVPTEPTTYIQLYQKGLALGGRAIDLMIERLDRLEPDESLSLKTLMDIANLGAKFATSQAGIVAKGIDITREKEEELDAFRLGDGGEEPSPRFGNHRVRVIEGEARPIVDRGRADRRAYNEKAAQDGSPTLPA